MDTLKLTFSREDKIYDAALTVVSKMDCDELRLSELLHPNEIAYYQSLKNNSSTTYVLGRLAAKMGVHQLTNSQDFRAIEIAKGVFEQPIVHCSSSQAIDVSISHTDSFAMAITCNSEHPVSIDIEQIDNTIFENSTGDFTPHEINIMKQISSDTMLTFSLFWSVKESLSKIIKTGLMLPFNKIEIQSIKHFNSYYELQYCHFTQYKSISWLFQNIIVTITIPRKSYLDLNGIYKFLSQVFNRN